ncbi:hypothetical protein SAMN05421858_0192 [Haladaptatus litoreus]|uniref:Uncharacterized protein n=2 Tax=Haladaptatus litoreus TaxID=553468 RepID=A0A1N6V321_9EURY|nr:hypothetical protein SAMN05421858_0192 [Haladaptatus litoreus]
MIFLAFFPDMARIKRSLAILLALVGVSFVVHYALFGSLPLGKPQLMEAEADEAEATVQ